MHAKGALSRGSNACSGLPILLRPSLPTPAMSHGLFVPFNVLYYYGISGRVG